MRFLKAVKRRTKRDQIKDTEYMIRITNMKAIRYTERIQHKVNRTHGEMDANRLVNDLKISLINHLGKEALEDLRRKWIL